MSETTVRESHTSENKPSASDPKHEQFKIERQYRTPEESYFTPVRTYR